MASIIEIAIGFIEGGFMLSFILGILILVSCQGEDTGKPIAKDLFPLTTENVCTHRYHADSYSFELPCDYTGEIDFTNPSSPEYVIKERRIFRGPTGADIVVDVWESHLPLDQWIESFQPYAVYHDSIFVDRGRVGKKGFDGILFTAIGIQSYNKDFVILTTGKHIIRIMYVISDNGASRVAWETMLATLDSR